MIEILLVEDNPGDVRLTQEALKEGRILNRLSVVNDGDAALEFLFQRGGYEDAPKPDLILLDLNLPKRDGREVLQAIKAEPSLRRTPVVILTTSGLEADVEQAYESHANAYITKPVDLDQFLEAVKTISEFWLQLVKFPEK
jgi:two-component system, chemotaxis family, response regulator Rcp1